jgi:hypothetical protein
MRVVLWIVILTIGAGATFPASARLQPDIVCLDPDIEFLVACDDDE